MKLPTLEELNRLSANGGKGATREVLAAWGVAWPPPSGWLKALKRAVVEHAGDKILKDDVRRANGKHHRKERKKAAPVKKEPKPFAPSPNRRNSTKSFYASWEWRRLRMEVLMEHGHRCQSCGATPKDVTISGAGVRIVVDHIKPLLKFWHLRLDRNNLQVLCDECNMGKGAWDDTDYRPANDDEGDAMTREWREIIGH